jgi:hypothetical protein
MHACVPTHARGIVHGSRVSSQTRYHSFMSSPSMTCSTARAVAMSCERSEMASSTGLADECETRCARSEKSLKVKNIRRGNPEKFHTAIDLTERMFREMEVRCDQCGSTRPCLLQLARANLLGGARIRAARTEDIDRAEHA